MDKMVNEYKLECYRKIMSMGEKGNLWLVEDSVSQNRFVMRKLPMDSQQVYQTLSSIHHANIVKIIDIFSHNGFLYVIEEYLEWSLLSDMANQQRLSRHRIMSIGRQLFLALSVLHKHNIVHRDIKPENIMIDDHDNVKLIDFDIARIFTADKNNDTTIKGSRDYAPPEQFGFAQSDQRTDIYSLGVTLNELAVGRLPEDRLCTGRLGVIIKRCIEFDPKRRYQNAAQALQHMRWLEKRAMLFTLCGVILSLSLLIFALHHLERKPVSSFEEEMPFTSAQDPDRIIDVQEPEQYPAFLMQKNQTYEFSADLGQNLPVNISAKKTNAQLSLTCLLADGDMFDFKFDDVFSTAYKQQGYSNNTDVEKTTPEYEILLDDLDQNGTTDLLVTLARRCRIDTPDPANRYYLTEYSTLWVVYMTENNTMACSEPLYFNGYTPTLENGILIFNPECNEWYTFQNGSWH